MTRKLRDAKRIGAGQLLAGDCLTRLGDLQRQRPRFDLIYVDPPFNAGGSRGARREKGARNDGAFAYRDAWGGLDGFLKMLAPRLEAMASLLSAQGSLWVHLDYRAVHDTKIALDSLLGRRAFRGEIIWVPGNGGRSRTGPSVTHQTILVYAPGQLIWNADDAALREPYADTSLSMHFNQTDADGRRYRERTIGKKTYRYYADVGRRLGSVWSDCPAMRANTPLNPETTGYPTQKPERLLERILRASTLPESQVLDPMCGSGTTLAVAERLGRPWVGIDQSKTALETATKRLQACVQKQTSPGAKSLRGSDA